MAAVSYEITDLSHEEINILIDELDLIKPGVKAHFRNILQVMPDITPQEAAEYIVLNDPKLWAKVHLDWDSRDYQDDILEEGKLSKKLVLRLGRRLGKTECMCVLILWHAFAQPNIGANGQYDILIVTPFETQIDLIFTRLNQLIDSAPNLKASITRDISHRLEFGNGTNIIGLTAGSKSNTGAANTRGQRADLIIFDEVDYIGASEITNVVNIRNEAPERIKIIAASTPSGRRENYYDWCTKAVKSYEPSEEDVKNFCFNGYQVKHIDPKLSNGWTHIYAPSIVNSELLKMNPDTGLTYLDELKNELTDMRFKQEVLAEFGEEQMGVYQVKYIDAATNLGLLSDHKYLQEMTPDEIQEWKSQRQTKQLYLGVDWDKYSAATHMVIMEIDYQWTHPETGVTQPMTLVRDHIEIPQSEFTYVNAIEKIVQLHKDYNFDWISVDRGYGETQIELLRQYGVQHPSSRLAERVVGYQFSEKIKVRDPYTNKMDKKPLKPFMVNNSVKIFERGSIVMNPRDESLKRQFEGYHVKSISSTGVPTFNSDDEHGLDAVNLALLKFEQEHGELFKRMTTHKLVSIPGLFTEDNIADRVEPVKPTSMLVSRDTLHKAYEANHGSHLPKTEIFVASSDGIGASSNPFARRTGGRGMQRPRPFVGRGGKF